MSYRIGETREHGFAFFWCDTSDRVFGPMIYGGREVAERIVEKLGHDPRKASITHLEELERVVEEMQEERYDANS